MQIQTVEYSKVFNLGDYQNEKIGVIVQVGQGEDPKKALEEAKAFVEFSSENFGRLLEQSREIIENPGSHTVNSVKRAEEIVRQYEGRLLSGSVLLPLTQQS